MLSWPTALGSQHHQLGCHHDLQFSIQTHVIPSPGPPARVRSPLSFPQHLSCFLSHVAKGNTPKPCGPHLAWLPRLGLNPSTNLPLQPHFRLLPHLATSASIPIFFQLFWAAIVSLGRCGPVVCCKLSKLSHRCCNQGVLPPSYILGGSHSHLPGSKHGHSCLTHP